MNFSIACSLHYGAIFVRTVMSDYMHVHILEMSGSCGGSLMEQRKGLLLNIGIIIIT